jgi:hypothetical protein
MRKSRHSLVLIAASGLLWLIPAVGQAQVISWGILNNDPAWNRALHVTGARQGCSDSPASCLRFAATVNQKYPGAKVFLAISLENFASKDYASQYGQLSGSTPYLEEIGIDDFINQYGHFVSAHGSAALGQAIDRMKSGNPNLKFGITLYENELTRAELEDPTLPGATRQKIDYVHLYLHYRTNAPSYGQYVKQARSLFPKARIIAGSYAYDRIDYIPCAPSDSSPCTFQQELDLHKRLLEEQIQLLKSGEVAWLEFYPGNIGREADWQNWRANSRMCKSERIQDCIKNTVNLHQATLDLLISRGLAEPLARQ